MSAIEKAKAVLNDHDLISLATVTPEGLPNLRSVDFAVGDKENILYFTTFKGSAKLAEIENNPNVFITVDHACHNMHELEELCFIRARGTAAVVKSPEEVQNAMGFILMKFPYLKDLPGDPNDFAVVRIDLKKILVVDNKQEWNHTEEINY